MQVVVIDIFSESKKWQLPLIIANIYQDSSKYSIYYGWYMHQTLFPHLNARAKKQFAYVRLRYYAVTDPTFMCAAVQAELSTFIHYNPVQRSF